MKNKRYSVECSSLRAAKSAFTRRLVAFWVTVPGPNQSRFINSGWLVITATIKYEALGDLRGKHSLTSYSCQLQPLPHEAKPAWWLRGGLEYSNSRSCATRALHDAINLVLLILLRAPYYFVDA